MRVLYIKTLICVIAVNAHAQWSQFYSTPDGSSLNGGSDPNSTAKASGTNGKWNASTGTYTFASPTDLRRVSTNDAASFYADGGTIAEFTAWITDVNDATDTITVSVLQSKSGVAPRTSPKGVSCNIGGAWTLPRGFTTNQHPQRASTTWPYSHIGVGLTNASGHPVMWWIKGNGDTNVSDYQLTATTNHAQGPYFIQGYTHTPGDTGFARLDYTNTIANMGLSPQTFAGVGGVFMKQLYFTGGGDAASGNKHNRGLVNCTTFADVDRCIFTEAWETALRLGAPGSAVRRSLFLNNQHNAASGKAAIEAVNPVDIYQNVIGDQAYRPGDNGADGIALVLSAGLPAIIEENIIYNIWGTGIIQSGNAANAKIRNNLIYKTTLYGITFPFSPGGSTNLSDLRIENNIMVECHTGIRGNTTFTKYLFAPFIKDNAFFKCTNGTINFMITNRVSGSIQLTANPWVDPRNGDFSLNNTPGGGAALRGIGGPSWLGSKTTSYRDIGPAQHQDVESNRKERSQ